jgi:NAD(P)-dependent dehydrogenase (short-subunit alcohol dehydrogenase family)
MIGELAGRTAVVTGGASGIGRATAALLASRGAAVCVLDRAPDDRQHGHACDITDDGAVRTAIAAVVAERGGLDILVNNAGIAAVGTVADNADDEWQRVFDVNVLGVVRVTRAALPHLRRSPHAAVVNIGSIAGTLGLPERALYSATKGAVVALTRAMAADHIGDGIRVNSVSPATVDTPWVERLLAAATDPDAARAALTARQPHGRLVTADEVAGAVAYLVGPAAASVNGTDLLVDAGMSGLRVPAV